MSKFDTKNGHEGGAIWSNRDETLSSDTAMMRPIFLVHFEILKSIWNILEYFCRHCGIILDDFGLYWRLIGIIFGIIWVSNLGFQKTKQRCCIMS